jgi:hypothetical protein
VLISNFAFSYTHPPARDARDGEDGGDGDSSAWLFCTLRNLPESVNGWESQKIDAIYSRNE